MVTPMQRLLHVVSIVIVLAAYLWMPEETIKAVALAGGIWLLNRLVLWIKTGQWSAPTSD